MGLLINPAEGLRDFVLRAESWPRRATVTEARNGRPLAADFTDASHPQGSQSPAPVLGDGNRADHPLIGHCAGVGLSVVIMNRDPRRPGSRRDPGCGVCAGLDRAPGLHRTGPGAVRPAGRLVRHRRPVGDRLRCGHPRRDLPGSRAAVTGVRWGLSPRDWKAHVVDPCGLHSREFYIAICGRILVAGTPLSRVPQWHRCPGCLR